MPGVHGVGEEVGATVVGMLVGAMELTKVGCGVEMVGESVPQGNGWATIRLNDQNAEAGVP